jgi:PBP1b-binding outer membrane lipoprotein LpoB
VRRTAALLLAALTLVAAGCGGDKEKASKTTSVPAAPALTTPATSVPELQTRPQTAPAQTSTSGGSTAPPTTVPDSPTNDTPPPPGSPAQRFEQFCNDNPQACR